MVEDTSTQHRLYHPTDQIGGTGKSFHGIGQFGPTAFSIKKSTAFGKYMLPECCLKYYNVIQQFNVTEPQGLQ